MHAHIETRSQDCDGRYTRSYVCQNWDNDIADAFKDQTLASHVPLLGSYASVEITPDGFSVREATEEGYCHTNVEWCTDDCVDVKPTYQDHRAEAMGY